MKDFLNKHSANYLEMAFRSDRCEVLTKPDGYGKSKGACGDAIEIFLTIKGNHIQWVALAADGCINTRACANTVAEMAEGKAIDDAWRIKVDDVILYLETLPAESRHCAELAVGALYQALTDCRATQRDPWKKLYKTI